MTHKLYKSNHKGSNWLGYTTWGTEQRTEQLTILVAAHHQIALLTFNNCEIYTCTNNNILLLYNAIKSTMSLPHLCHIIKTEKYSFLWWAMVCWHFKQLWNDMSLQGAFKYAQYCGCKISEKKKWQLGCYWQEEQQLNLRKCQGCQESKALLCLKKTGLGLKG